MDNLEKKFKELEKKFYETHGEILKSLGLKDEAYMMHIESGDVQSETDWYADFVSSGDTTKEEDEDTWYEWAQYLIPVEKDENGEWVEV